MSDYKQFFIKQGDTLPVLQATLKSGEDGITPVDLSNIPDSDILFKMKQRNKADTLVTIQCSPMTLVDKQNGKVQVQWQSQHTSTPGVYEAEFEITNQDGNKETFPNTDPFIVKVVKDRI